MCAFAGLSFLPFVPASLSLLDLSDARGRMEEEEGGQRFMMRRREGGKEGEESGREGRNPERRKLGTCTKEEGEGLLRRHRKDGGEEGREKRFCRNLTRGRQLLRGGGGREGGDDASVQAIPEKKGASVAVAFQPILPADGGIGRRGKGFWKVGGQTFLDVYMGNFFC